MAECEKCMWYGMCHSSDECDHFTPTEINDGKLVEDFRWDYYQEWNAYLGDSDQ